LPLKRKKEEIEILVRLTRVRNGPKYPIFVDDVDKDDENEENNQISGEETLLLFLLLEIS
jgi:hypothetical protein